MTGASALSVRGVHVTIRSGRAIVEDVSFEVGQGAVLGLVGESGSGKTTASLAALAYARPGARITEGQVVVEGQDLLGADESTARSRRGSLIAYVPQDPGTALNPSLRVESQLREMLLAHGSKGEWEHIIAGTLAKVGLPSDKAFRRRYPHQLSGGQQQRLAIAVALICDPAVLVMDEPTTGLDVVTQALVLAEVKRLCSTMGVAIVYVSHDLAVVAEVATEIAVMYAGRVVEHGPAVELLLRPRHPYTAGLVSSIPDHLEPRELRGIPGVAVGVDDRPAGCAFAPRCAQSVPACRLSMPDLDTVSVGHSVRCIRWSETPPVSVEERRLPVETTRAAALLTASSLRAVHHSRSGTVVAVNEVSFSIGRQECLALVGESGSGKTTIARCIAGLHRPAGGTLVFDGAEMPALARQRPRELRRRVQIVFQNPYDSLNPRHSVEETISRPLRLFRRGRSPALRPRILELLDQVRLPRSIALRYPGELSGGERQRVAIARALAPQPELLICDEVTSALDVSVQAVVLDLLADLRRELGLALLFITHDLGVVASIADSVLVLERGNAREWGPVGPILSSPTAPYTRALIEAAPRLPRPGEARPPA